MIIVIDAINNKYGYEMKNCETRTIMTILGNENNISIDEFKQKISEVDADYAVIKSDHPLAHEFSCPTILVDGYSCTLDGVTRNIRISNDAISLLESLRYLRITDNVTEITMDHVTYEVTSDLLGLTLYELLNGTSGLRIKSFNTRVFGDTHNKNEIYSAIVALCCIATVKKLI